jgi:tetratricopeptide (TPR) repeat protein
MIKKLLAIVSLILKQRSTYIISILISVTVLYLPVFKNVLTNWDDELYVVYNPYLTTLSFENLKNIFTKYYAGNYHPLTLISLAVDFKIGGAEAWPYQLTNLILHLCNTLLVYIFVKSLITLKDKETSKFSVIPLIVALLFGIHPFQVESVAWVSERKNVLYTFFFLASLLAYIKYLHSNYYRFYSLALLLFIFSLLSKGMAVPLSLCIICTDYFAGRNLLSRKVILEKIPFLALSLIFGIIAILAQHSSNSMRIDTNFAWFERIALASYGFIQYIVKLCFPFHLSAFYPYPVNPGTALPYYFYAYIILIVSLFLILWRYYRKNSFVVFGTLFFLANISIVIQLLPVGDAIIADRYVYIPSIGFFIILAYYCNVLWQKGYTWKYLTISILIIYGSVLGFKTYHRVGVWKDSLTLWNDAIKKYPENNDRAYQNRGNKLLEIGNIAAALEDYKRLLQIDPKNSAGYIGMGHIKYASNDLQGALNYLNIALNLAKTYEGYITRAVVKIDMKDYAGALADSDSAYQLNPYRTGTLINKGFIFLQMGNYQDALDTYNHALRLDSLNSKAYKGRALAKKAMQDMDGALNDLNISLALNESYDCLMERALVKMAVNDFDGARSDLYLALQMNPNSFEVYINRGIIELNMGNYDNALKEFNAATSIDSASFHAYVYKAIAKMNLSNFAQAIDDLNTSVKIQPSAEAFYYRGLANIKLGKKVAGCNDLNQAMLMGNGAAKVELEKNCR